MGEAELIQEADYLEDSEATKVTDADVYRELIAQSGNIGATARTLRVSRQWLKGRIERKAALVSILQDMRETVIDQAEVNVFNDVLKNDPTANRFVLTTIGKDRGYSSGVSGSGKNGEIVIQINKLADIPE